MSVVQKGECVDRRIAIIHEHGEYAANVNGIVSALMANCVAPEITVFTRTPEGGFNAAHERCSCRNEVIPAECDNEPKVRNWINSRYAGFSGFLHVLTDSVELLRDPSGFVSDLERMMSALDYPLWLNTACDGCNMVYSKYNPRMRIQCDRPECEKLGLSGELDFTSHSNTQWVCYDMRAMAGSDLLRFDERFTVPMFFIIELLARRRNTKAKGSLFFMNQYLTVGSEYGTFRNLKGMRQEQPDQKKMQEEDAAFKAMGVNFSPDNNIDEVLETLWEKIVEKAGKAV